MSTTPNYGLYLPGQGKVAWDDKMNGNLTTIDATLQALADIVEGAVYQINNVTYVAANARWNGSTWNRVNTGAPAVRLALNSTAGTLEVATAAAGANPITWTITQAFSATGLDMKSKKIANLGAPAASTDAATKAYVDGLIAALKLSQIAIDANKNWGGKSITNVGAIEADLLKGRLCSRVTLSDDIILSIPGPIAVPTGSTSVKIKEITLGPEHYGTNNQYRVKYTHSLTSSGWSMSHLRINDVKVTPTIKGTESCSYDATGLKAGDKIQIWTLLGTTNPGYSSNNGFGNITNFQLCGVAELVHDPPINSVTL